LHQLFGLLFLARVASQSYYTLRELLHHPLPPQDKSCEFSRANRSRPAPKNTIDEEELESVQLIAFRSHAFVCLTKSKPPEKENEIERRLKESENADSTLS